MTALPRPPRGDDLGVTLPVVLMLIVLEYGLLAWVIYYRFHRGY